MISLAGGLSIIARETVTTKPAYRIAERHYDSTIAIFHYETCGSQVSVDIWARIVITGLNFPALSVLFFSQIA
jgi:hypothetical protein